MRTILVTGAAGFAGSHLIDRLARPEVQVIAWRRPRTDEPHARREAVAAPAATRATPVAWEEVELLERESVAQAVARRPPDDVFHCAGAPHVGKSWEDTTATLESNVRGTHHLLDALLAHAPRARVLVPSSATVYARADTPIVETAPLGPSSPYGISKLAQEMLALRYARDEGLHVVIARSFNHVGPRQSEAFFASSFARQLARIEAGLAPPVLSVGNLEARRDLTDVRDTVRAYELLLERGASGEVYNVCSGQAYTIGDVLQRLLTAVHVNVDVQVDPSRLRPNDTPLVLGDPSRLRACTGWAPEIPFDRTLRDLLDYWRERVTD